MMRRAAVRARAVEHLGPGKHGVGMSAIMDGRFHVTGKGREDWARLRVARLRHVRAVRAAMLRMHGN